MSNFAHAGVVLVLGASLWAAGCGGGSSSELPRGSRAEAAECKGDRISATDVDQDGRIDIEDIARGGRRFCTRADMNFDGSVDMERFFDADGVQVVHERHDFDFDGRFDQLSFFEDGQLVRKELDTNFDNTIDTWLWCGDGWVVRSERDRRHDGKADVWETYERGLIVEARYDDNHDGRVDKWDTFRSGKLFLTQYDDNGDGQPDRSQEMPIQSMGPPEDALRCESASQAKGAALSGGAVEGTADGGQP